MISSAWQEHRAVREVMLFLQTHGISTLFAVRNFLLTFCCCSNMLA
jgi:exodeoxyribonuclease V alpha subunit